MKFLRNFWFVRANIVLLKQTITIWKYMSHSCIISLRKIIIYIASVAIPDSRTIGPKPCLKKYSQNIQPGLCFTVVATQERFYSSWDFCHTLLYHFVKIGKRLIHYSIGFLINHLLSSFDVPNTIQDVLLYLLVRLKICIE